MARQGRFARTTAGSQNMSSLIYALLREERNNQEETMLTAYANNMRGGTTRNSFTSGGVTNSATADSVYQWYVSQANLAKSTGDTASYDRLMQRAEQFRLSSLKDQEDLARTSFANGTSVDRSLLGGSGTGVLDLAEYEKILNGIANDPSMTDSDRSRIKLTLFNASYDSTASDMIRKYQEKTISADSLVAFYDKELARAKENGVIESSQTYQDILNARSRAIQAQKSDAAQGRVDAVAARIKDEQLALATSLQTLLEPVIESTFSSAKTVAALTGPIKGDGEDFITTLINALTNETNVNLSTLIERAGLQQGMDATAIEELQSKFSDYADEVNALYKAGFVNETTNLRKISLFLGNSSARGIYGATMREASTKFNDAIMQSGGSTSIPFSSDPYAYRNAYKEWASTAAAVSGNDKYEDILFADQVSRISSGDLTDLLPGFQGSDMAQLVDEIAASTGLDIQTVGKSLGLLATGADAYWNSQDSALQSVANVLNGLSGNTIQANLQSGVSAGGGLTVGDIVLGAVQGYMTDVVDKDPNLVWAYQYDPGTRQSQFVPVDTPTVSNSVDYVAWTQTGKGSEIVYVKRQQMVDENGSQIPNMYYVPVPGGSNFAGSTGGSMDNNDFIEFVSGGNTFKLTLQDLEDFRTYSGNSGITPQAGLDQNNQGVVKIGRSLYDALTSTAGGSLFTAWLQDTYNIKGQDWYDQRVTIGKDTTGANDKVDNLVTNYGNMILSSIGPTYDGDISAAVKSYLTRFGVTDKTGKLTGLITTYISPSIKTTKDIATEEYYKRMGGTGYTPPIIPNQTSPYPAAPAPTPTWGYGSDTWRANNPGLIPSPLPGNAPAITTPPPTPIGMNGDRDQYGGRDWFFRNLGGSNASLTTNPLISPEPSLIATGTVRGTNTKRTAL